jgi:saccharopine dehydrogenase-like NADP-dependent oxidoreductase
LGGNPDVSSKINKKFETAKRACCFTDLGLAPGYVSILAEKGYAEVSQKDQVHSVEMFCGGLPANNCLNKLGYALTFSTKGLYNEYTGDCEVIEGGEIMYRPALSDRQFVLFKGYPQDDMQSTLEAFHTRGGTGTTIQSMHKRGVKECFYKTMRWRGHHDYLTFMLHQCKMDYETFEKCIETACPSAANVKDLIFIRVVVDIDHPDEFVPVPEWEKCMVIGSDDQWTSMQRTTAFPAAAVAGLMGEGKFDGKTSLRYEDIPIPAFEENLSFIDPDAFG